MAPTPELIYCAGGNRAFAETALAVGYKLGAQLPDTVYCPPLYFADQDWKRPNRAAYMAALADHRPVMATVLDLERGDQLPEVLDWAEEAAQHAQRVLIIPKCRGVIARLPRRVGGAEVVLAYSVPTGYGGAPISPQLFAGWPVHLLGGSPHLQRRLWELWFRDIAEVVSVDGNMANKMAHRCRFWSPEKGPKGHWRGLNEVGAGNFGKGSNLEAFRRSCENIIGLWKRSGYVQRAA